MKKLILFFFAVILLSLILLFSQSYILKQNKYEFEGKWNYKKGKQIAYKVIKSYPIKKFNFDIAEKEASVKHRYLGYYFLPTLKPSTYYIIFSTESTYNNCHPCSSPISIFQFQENKAHDKWVLTAHTVAAFKAGIWGKVSADQVGVINIGSNLYAIAIKYSNLSQGYFSEGLSLYIPFQKEWKQILNLQIAADNSNDTYSKNKDVWHSNLQFAQQGNGVSNILVESIGSNDGKNFHTNEVFIFDGKAYNNKFFQSATPYKPFRALDKWE